MITNQDKYIEGFMEKPGVEKMLALLKEQKIIKECFSVYDEVDGEEEYPPDEMAEITPTPGPPTYYKLELNSVIFPDHKIKIENYHNIPSLKLLNVMDDMGLNLWNTEDVDYKTIRMLAPTNELALSQKGIVSLFHLCKWEVNGDRYTGLQWFPASMLALEEEDSKPGVLYNFADLLRDILESENLFTESNDQLVIKYRALFPYKTPAILTPEAREEIEAYLTVFNEGEQQKIKAKRKLDLQLFGREATPPTAQDLEKYSVVVKPHAIIIPDAKARDMIPNFYPGNIHLTDSGQLAFYLTPKDAKEPRKMFLSIENVDGLEFSTPIDQYDLTLLDASITLLESQGYFTENQLFELVLTKGNKPNQERKTDARARLNKMINTKVKISTGFTKDMKGKELPASTTLPLLNVGVRENAIYYGNFTTIYVAVGLHGLYEHARQLGHIKTMPIDLNAIPKLLDTTANITLKNTLFRHINSTLFNPNMNKYIKLETIATKCGIELGEGANARNKKKRLRESLEVILKAWKQKGFVTSYEWRMNGRSYAGLTIYANKEYLKPTNAINGGVVFPLQGGR